jgi:hypothetical protein
VPLFPGRFLDTEWFPAALFTRPKAIESTSVLLFGATIKNQFNINRDALPAKRSVMITLGAHGHARRGGVTRTLFRFATFPQVCLWPG